MKIEQINHSVKGIPHMTVVQATVMTELIIANRYYNILELGFLHGVSTCYMAGAVDELGDGHVTAIDLVRAKSIEPNINHLLEKTGLTDYVTLFYEPTSYVWRLMKMLEENPEPQFDFCYIDGAHNWFADGFAFFLVDRLLKPGGTIVFDDLDWIHATSPAMKDMDVVKQMPDDEKTTPHIRKVYELLVKPHPNYSEFVERDGWGIAKKISVDAVVSTGATRKEIVYETKHVGLGGFLMKVYDRLKG